MKRILGILVIALTFFLGGCTGSNDNENTVYATLYPQYDVLRYLTENTEINVKYVLPPGVSAHTFEPSPSTITTFLSSDLFVYANEDLEPWVHNMIETIDLEESKIIDLSSYMTLIEADDEHDDEEEHDVEEHHHEYDPHFWSVPSNMIIMVNVLEDALVETYPEYETIIAENADDYIALMNEVEVAYQDWEINRTLDILMHGGHNSIGYVVDAYHIEYVNPYEGFSTDAEPTPQAIADMIDLMNQEEITYLFSEKLLSQTVVNTITEETGASILYIYSMGNVSQEDYDNQISVYNMMMHNLEQYKIGLGYDESN